MPELISIKIQIYDTEYSVYRFRTRDINSEYGFEEGARIRMILLIAASLPSHARYRVIIVFLVHWLKDTSEQSETPSTKKYYEFGPPGIFRPPANRLHIVFLSYNCFFCHRCLAFAASKCL
jgi:hypothetical protein